MLQAKRIRMVVTAGLLLLLISPTMADEVTDQVNEAIKLYKEGKLSQAASDLEFAAQQIRTKQAEKLKDALPKPLAGWKADEPQFGAAGAAMFGGGVTATRRYFKGSRDESEVETPEVQVEIVTDSPLLQGMLPLFSNPAILGSQGGKVIKVKSYRAILKKEEGAGTADLSIVVANKILVTVRGQTGATESDMLAYGNAMNYSLLEQMAAP